MLYKWYNYKYYLGSYVGICEQGHSEPLRNILRIKNVFLKDVGYILFENLYLTCYDCPDLFYL